MRFFQYVGILVCAFAVLSPLAAGPFRQDEPRTPVTELALNIQNDKIILNFEEEHGYLRSLLQALHIPVSSQTLVFSKSSFQLNQISPEAPRAVYFNDDTYIGWVNRGQFIEIAEVDPKTGPSFYNTLVRARADDIDDMKKFIARMDLSSGANLTSLSSKFDTKEYISPHSDIVALIVLGHQTHVHNMITSGSYEIRDAIAQGHTAKMDEIVKDAGERIVRAMLFVGEAQLAEPVKGTSSFADDFMKRGPRDSKGRSLRDLDLQHRLLRYPLSYLIYSKSFDAMPDELRSYVLKRIREVLTSEDKSADFAHVTEADRKDILEILSETKPGFTETRRGE
jgi:hypothetical protein